MTEIKNCRTCAHCEIHDEAIFDYCILSGEKCWMVRKYPNHLCDENFSGWVPRTFTMFLLDNRFLIVMIVGVIFITLSSIMK
jgi:hypothetical protein